MKKFSAVKKLLFLQNCKQECVFSFASHKMNNKNSSASGEYAVIKNQNENSKENERKSNTFHWQVNKSLKDQKWKQLSEEEHSGRHCSQ
jgi:hypothetical protein